MRVILKQGDKPEVRNLSCGLQKCGLEFIIVEDHSKQEPLQLSDDEINAASMRDREFTVTARVLTDEEVMERFAKMGL